MVKNGRDLVKISKKDEVYQKITMGDRLMVEQRLFGRLFFACKAFSAIEFYKMPVFEPRKSKDS